MISDVAYRDALIAAKNHLQHTEHRTYGLATQLQVKLSELKINFHLIIQKNNFTDLRIMELRRNNLVILIKYYFNFFHKKGSSLFLTL